MCLVLLGVMPNDVKLIRFLSALATVGGIFLGVVYIQIAYNRWFVERSIDTEYEGGDTLSRCGADIPDLGCALAVFIVFLHGLSLVVMGFFMGSNLIRNGGGKIYDRTKMKGQRFQDEVFKKPSRIALDDLWRYCMTFLAFTGVTSLMFAIATHLVRDRAPFYTFDNFIGDVFNGCVRISCWLIFTTHRRRKMIAFLSSINAKEQRQSAASIACIFMIKHFKK